MPICRQRPVVETTFVKMFKAYFWNVSKLTTFDRKTFLCQIASIRIEIEEEI